MKNSHFVLGIFLVIFLARLAPHVGSTGGILKPEWTVKYLAVSIIFLNSGLTLPTEDFTVAILQWDLHLFIQCFTFIAFPAIVAALVSMLAHSFLHSALLEGMTLLSTMPPPVSSAIILTKAVGGNEGGAVFNSALGSMLGIVVTPTLILFLLGAEKVEVPTEKIFQQLFITVVIPLVIGQLIRNVYFRWLQRQNIPFKTIGHLLILFIIYTTFCSTFSRTDFRIDMRELITVIFIMFALQISVQLFLLQFSHHILDYPAEDAVAIMYTGSHKNLTLVFLLQTFIMLFLIYTSSSPHLQYTSTDSITIMYCGTHKSLTLGIPMIEIIFEGSPFVSYYSIPLLIYNPMQIVLGGLSIGVMQQWLSDMKRRRRRSQGQNRSRRSSVRRRSDDFE